MDSPAKKNAKKVSKVHRSSSESSLNSLESDVIPVASNSSDSGASNVPNPVTSNSSDSGASYVPNPVTSNSSDYGASYVPNLKGTTTKQDHQRSRDEKDKLTKEVQLAESEAYLSLMSECYFKEDFNDKMKELDEKIEREKREIDHYKKLLDERETKIKAIRLIKERHDVLIEVSKILDSVPDEIDAEFIETKKKIMQELEQAKSPLTLKNFSTVSASDKDEIVKNLKDTYNAMKTVTGTLSKSANIDKKAELLDKFSKVKNMAQKCEQEVQEVNKLMIKYMSLKLGLSSRKS